MDKNQIVILKENFWEICDSWGVRNEVIPFTLVLLAGKKVCITGITLSGLFIQVNNINVSIPSYAVITLNQERKNKIKNIFDEDRGHSNTKGQHPRCKRTL